MENILKHTIKLKHILLLNEWEKHSLILISMEINFTAIKTYLRHSRQQSIQFVNQNCGTIDSNCL